LIQKSNSTLLRCYIELAVSNDEIVELIPAGDQALGPAASCHTNELTHWKLPLFNKLGTLTVHAGSLDQAQ